MKTNFRNKAILIALLCVLLSFPVSAQSQQKKIFKTEAKSTAAKDTLKTGYIWEDSKGNQYPIIVNKKSGACYVWRTSSKSGKQYRTYMKPEVAQAVCKELGIAYKGKKLR